MADGFSNFGPFTSSWRFWMLIPLPPRFPCSLWKEMEALPQINVTATWAGGPVLSCVLELQQMHRWGFNSLCRQGTLEGCSQVGPSPRE